MTIRWGILGCGDIARKRVAEAILADPASELAAVCRRTPEKLERFRADFRAPRAYTDADELIADAAIDVVYVATPVHLHRPQTIAAARAGKHVLVEKPMAMSTAECDEMIEACRAAGVKLGVAYYRRFYPIVERMGQLIAEGRIGRPLAVSAATSTPLAIAPGEDGYWRVILREGGGGPLMDVGSHRLDLFANLFGPAADVKACCDTLAADYEAEDTATLVVQFERGLHGTLHCFFGRTPEVDSFTVLGTRGQLIADPLNGEELVILTDEGRHVESHPRPENTHLPLVADFAAAITEDRPPRITGEAGRAASDIIERAYRDARRTVA